MSLKDAQGQSRPEPKQKLWKDPPFVMGKLTINGDFP